MAVLYCNESELISYQWSVDNRPSQLIIESGSLTFFVFVLDDVIMVTVVAWPGLSRAGYVVKHFLRSILDCRAAMPQRSTSDLQIYLRFT